MNKEEIVWYANEIGLEDVDTSSPVVLDATGRLDHLNSIYSSLEFKMEIGLIDPDVAEAILFVSAAEIYDGVNQWVESAEPGEECMVAMCFRDYLRAQIKKMGGYILKEH